MSQHATLVTVPQAATPLITALLPHSQFVEYVPEEAVHLQPLQRCAVPTHGALPGTAVAVHLEVGLDVKALQVLALGPARWDGDAAVSDGAPQGGADGRLLDTVILTTEELLDCTQ